MLHEDFYVSLMDLPEEYDFGMYSSFINTFGTHYVTEGTMGGTLEYVLVLNKTSMANSSTVDKRLLIFIHSWNVNNIWFFPWQRLKPKKLVDALVVLLV